MEQRRHWKSHPWEKTESTLVETDGSHVGVELKTKRGG